MNAHEIAEVLCSQVPCGPRMHVGMTADDYAAVIFDRIAVAVSDRRRVSAGVLLGIRGLMAAGGVFGPQQHTDLRENLPRLRVVPS